MLSIPTLDDLVSFSGRAVEGYSTFVDAALAQATLIFSIVTKRSRYPDDADGRQLAVNAILQLADLIYLEQPYASVKANPYGSETIGSYTYSKGSTAYLVAKARPGELTGLFWFDLAVEELSLVDRSLVTSGSVKVVNDDLYVSVNTNDFWVIGPADIPGTGADGFPYDVNAELNPRPKL